MNSAFKGFNEYQKYQEQLYHNFLFFAIIFPDHCLNLYILLQAVTFLSITAFSTPLTFSLSFLAF